MANSLRAGVIGVGHLGRHHARVYSELPGVELAAVVDIRSERARAIGEEFAAPSFESYEEVLHSLDAVSVVVPTKAHFEIAKAFPVVKREALWIRWLQIYLTRHGRNSETS